jgi:hemoglobin
MKDIIELEDVKTFVDGFYLKIQKDELLGPIFASRIADWTPHLEKMYRFWSSILLGTGDYRGAPFPKHLGLGIGERHFKRWLQLFEENMNALFSGKNADEAINRSKTIAQIFSYKIDLLEG